MIIPLTNNDIKDIKERTEFDDETIIACELKLVCEELLQARSVLSYGSSLFLSYQEDNMPVELRDFLHNCYVMSQKFGR
jgi:hypothetical protein